MTNELKLYRVNFELLGSTFDETVNKRNITIGISTSIIKSVHFYTGILAPSATCWVDITFKDETRKPKCYLICGHYAASKSAARARELNLTIIGDETRKDAPVLECQENITEHVV